MEAETLRSYRLEFARQAQDRREDERRRASEIRVRDKYEEAEERKRDRQDDEFELVVMATELEISNFTAKLDHYDAATVEALMENRQAMELLQKSLNDMLAEAYVLPDGRRVFKTEDGLRVFDEHGQELSAAEVDPHEIDDSKPRWEMFRAAGDQLNALSEERQQLLDYQQELDTARERIRAGSVTEDELKQMDEQLAKDLPVPVQKLLPSDMQPEKSADAELTTPEPFRPNVKLDMPTI